MKSYIFKVVIEKPRRRLAKLGGSASVQGSVDVITPIRQGAAGWTCTFTALGNDILIEVQTPGETITVYWVATIEYQSVSTDA